MTDNNVLTAVVILNWNGQPFLEKFLPSLIEHSTGADVIVIDNDSSDDSVAFLNSEFPNVRCIQNTVNGGFAKGYNDGLAQIQGEYAHYVLINSDIEVTPNWLEPLVVKMKDSTVAGVQPKVLAYHRKSHFEHAGASGGFMDKNYYPFCRGRLFDKLEEDLGQYDNDKQIFWTTGACMIIRASVFHELGGFDADFFAHMEEIDLCWRAKKRGYSFYVVPASKVYHVGGGTLNYENPRKTFLNFRNSLFMIHKNHEGWLFGKIIYRLLLDGLAAIKYLIAFRGTHVLAVLRAHFAYYRQLKDLNKKRKFIKTSSTEFNPVGFYNASLVWAYFFKGIKSFKGLNKRFFEN
jgi:GT2 family glycosyltransferase